MFFVVLLLSWYVRKCGKCGYGVTGTETGETELSSLKVTISLFIPLISSTDAVYTKKYKYKNKYKCEYKYIYNPHWKSPSHSLSPTALMQCIQTNTNTKTNTNANTNTNTILIENHHLTLYPPLISSCTDVEWCRKWNCSISTRDCKVYPCIPVTLCVPVYQL